MKRFYWTGISKDERIKAIDEIAGIIDKYGLILNSKRFSDISLSLVIEIEEFKIKDLYDSLKNIISITIDNDILVGSNTNCMIFLNISFVLGTGNLKIELPNVPG